MRFELNIISRNATDEELLQDMVQANTKLKIKGKKLTFRTYRTVGKYSTGTIIARFGSWNNGLSRAGLALNAETNIPIEALFDNLKIVWITKGKQPAYRDMSKLPSQHVGSTYLNRFGGWRKALEEFVTSVNQEENNLRNYEVEVKSNKNTTKKTKRDPSLSLRFLVMKRDNFCCAACGRSPATLLGLELELDHIIPWSQGGETIEENLQTLCFDCNRGKGASN